jgi:hypothetical protein
MMRVPTESLLGKTNLFISIGSFLVSGLIFHIKAGLNQILNVLERMEYIVKMVTKIKKKRQIKTSWSR